MKPYISGQISGLTWDEYSDNFARAEAFALANDMQPVNPLKVVGCESEDCNPENTEPHPGTGGYLHHWRCYMKKDLIQMLDECDSIIMLPNWKKSVGAGIELYVAQAVGMTVFYLNDDYTETHSD